MSDMKDRKNRENWTNWLLYGPSDAGRMREVEQAFGHLLPKDYKDFLSESDGGEGFIAENYLILWRSSELVEFNRDYEVERYAPGLLLFGSSGGGEAYGFDMRRNMLVVMVPFIGMSHSSIRDLAPTFSEFLQKMEFI